jgi:protein-S-isoprenylcysteine O-methyltransferase Ste14
MITGMRNCSFLWMTFFVLWMGAALFTKRPEERISWRRTLYYAIPVELYYLMFSLRFDIAWLQHRLFQRTDVLDWTAIVITVAGNLGPRNLGGNWSSAPMLREHPDLIRMVRHPIYTGIIVAMMGTFLANGKVRGALAVVLVWLAWTIKSRMEEEFMVRDFGQNTRTIAARLGRCFRVCRSNVQRRVREIRPPRSCCCEVGAQQPCLRQVKSLQECGRNINADESNTVGIKFGQGVDAAGGSSHVLRGVDDLPGLVVLLLDAVARLAEVEDCSHEYGEATEIFQNIQK